MNVPSAWPLLLALGGAAAASALAVAWDRPPTPVRDDPGAALARVRRPALDHGAFFAAPLEDGPAVTRACLRCHPDAAREVMATGHWTWGAHEVALPGADGPRPFGKRNSINNFCISIAANWPRCTSCHAGYGWRDGTFFDHAGPEQVDCLVCHDRSGQYEKDPAGAGLPAPGVDLLAAARSVGRPTRSNCGACHFAGGGGDAVKHGDLDGTLHHPPERVDVHMGRHDLSCVDCHRTAAHRIAGQIMPPAGVASSGGSGAGHPAAIGRVACTDCHAARPHGHARLDAHLDAVACETCHVPAVALDAPTKTSWDWSQAGADPAQVAARDPEVAADPHLYAKAKGRFTYAQALRPEYRWYDGTARRMLPGEPVDLARTVEVAVPRGDVGDPAARITPFKVHRGKQPADAEHRWLLTPKTFGPGGYWTDFDWDRALRLGAEASGLAYSGRFVWVETEMAWPLHHMVQRRERALGCAECHGPDGRMPWEALGYPADPAEAGGRRRLGLLRAAAGSVAGGGDAADAGAGGRR